MSHEEKSHGEGFAHQAVESHHKYEAAAHFGEGVKQLLESSGLLDLVDEFLSGAGLPTVAALGALVPGLHVVTPLIAFLVFRRAKRRPALPGKEPHGPEALDGPDLARVRRYLEGLSDPQVRADEARTRDQVAYLVGATAKKEDVWEVSRKLDRLLALGPQAFGELERKASASADFSAFIDALPSVLDKLEAIHDDVRETRDVAKETRDLVKGLTPARAGIGWRIAGPSAYATGQEEYLQKLRKILEAGGAGGITQPAGLRGLGGVGKTELALGYAAAYRGEYDAGVFLLAARAADLDFALARLAEPDLPEDADPARVAAAKDAALDRLGGDARTLVVLDNVDEIVGTAEFQAVLARLAGSHVVVTCRHRNLGEKVKELEVDTMPPEVGALYALRRGKGDEASGPWRWEDFKEQDRDDALDLSRELDGLPLALDHAGAAIRNDPMTVAETLADYRANRTRILKREGNAPSATHPDSAQVTVVRAWERLEERDEAAAQLVLVCAFLAPDAIAEDLFTNGMIDLLEPLNGAMGRFAALLRIAVRSALIERDAEAGRLAIHRVAQAVLQDLDGVDAANWLRGVTNGTVARLVHAGRYREAVAHAEFGAPEIARRRGEGDPLTLTMRNNLAFVYWAMGRHDEAVAIEEANLEATRAAQGEDHEDTLLSRNNLAETYRAMGRHDEARALHEATLVTRRRTLGEDHPATLRSQGNLASIYQSMGRHKEARRLHEATVAAMRRTLGVTHKDTLTSQNNLATTYQAMGRHEEARELHEATLATQRATLGEGHPDTLQSRHNLASTLYTLGRFAEALPHFEAAAAGHERALGADHPSTQNSYAGLEMCRAAMEREEKG